MIDSILLNSLVARVWPSLIQLGDLESNRLINIPSMRCDLCIDHS
jgi:hypothetical protein